MTSIRGCLEEVLRKKPGNFKAEKLYSELVESSKRTDIVLGSTEPVNSTASYVPTLKVVEYTD